MQPLRTDRTIFVVHSSDTACPAHLREADDWVEVDEPIAGALTIGYRGLSQLGFFEVAAIARVRAERSARAEGLDPHEEIGRDDRGQPITIASRLENGHLSDLTARRGIVSVHGVDVPSPAAIFDRLGPARAAALANRITAATILTHDPFANGASGS